MSDSKTKALAGRTVMNRWRAESFNALLQLFAPGGKWTDLYQALSEHLSLEPKQIACVRSGQQHLPSEDLATLRKKIEEQREKFPNDDIILELIQSVDVDRLGSAIGDETLEPQYRQEVADEIAKLPQSASSKATSSTAPSSAVVQSNPLRTQPVLVLGLDGAAAKLLSCPAATTGSLDFSEDGTASSVKIDLS